MGGPPGKGYPNYDGGYEGGGYNYNKSGSNGMSPNAIPSIYAAIDEIVHMGELNGVRATR